MDSELILGYDASCGKCAQIAARISEVSDGRLDVLPLTHDKVIGARRVVFGDSPPHQPTLVEIKGESVRAWVGRPLAFAMLKRVGLRRSLAISAALSDLNAAPTQGAGLSRATFLKGVLGAGAGLALLAATPATSAFAANRAETDAADGPGAWLEDIQIASSDEETAERAEQVLSRLSAENPETSRMNAQSHAARGLDVGREYRAVTHTLHDGRTLEAASVTSGSTVLFTYALVENGTTVRSHSRLMEVFASSEGGEQDMARLLMAEDNGDAWNLAATGCNQSTCSAQGACFTCVCTEYNLTCMFNCCGPCALACGNIVTCLACVGLWCPVCATVNRCCNKARCGWRESCS